MVNGRNGSPVIRKRFRKGSQKLNKLQLSVGRTRPLRSDEGRGRMMRISEAERRAISRARSQDRGLKALRVGRPRAV